MEGGEVERWLPRGLHQRAALRARGARPAHVLMKVETHNHPTAISPFPGASTGAGGEIRDEGATGRGARPKAGLTGFTRLEPAPARTPTSRGSASRYGKPEHIASALQIMIDGPLGGAAFNNEFGRPNLGGYFRVYEQTVGGAAPRLPQADHDRRRPRRDRGVADAQDRRSPPARCWSSSAARACASAWAAARPARWPPAPTPPSSTSTRCSAATRRSSAARRRSSTTAGRSATATRSWRSTTSAPAASRNAFPELVDGAGRGAALRPAQGAARGERPGAEGDLVQREPGALRDGGRARMRCRCSSDVRARALPVRGGRRGDRRAASWSLEDGPARGERADRHADGRAARQAAEDAPRRAARRASQLPPLDLDRRRAGAGRASTCCATRRSPASAS